MIINGHSQHFISAKDRALHYGDGCFTTLVFAQGKLLAWPLHLARLKQDCSRLGIDFNQWQELSDSAQHLVNQNSTLLKGVLKVIVTRGSGGRGYSPCGVTNPNYLISSHDFPHHYKEWQSKGIKLVSSSVKLGKQPLLAGIKHLNRLEQVLIKQQLTSSEFDDALVCNSDNEIVESSAGNIFWWHDDQWYTPKLDECGVVGVMRNQICTVLAVNNQPVKKVNSLFNKNFVAQEMFICNSLMQIVPVVSLQSHDGHHRWQFSCQQVKKLQILVTEALSHE
ncbi:aminodeoxychorismate lyase [Flavobacterium sp. W21_SRS_FM6]|uniref:aminodeoxychorismate lyase n=1 Tax=Flavobacterium sp. W21_SRS_FM6 TaxID=3240268 RepID=UPI003F8F079F